MFGSGLLCSAQPDRPRKKGGANDEVSAEPAPAVEDIGEVEAAVEASESAPAPEPAAATGDASDNG